MYKQLSTKLIKLTPEYIKSFTALPAYKGDRTRDALRGRRRIAKLRQKAIDGRFHSPSWSIVHLQENGNAVTYRANGGHSSLMLWQLIQEGLFDKCFPNGLEASVVENEAYNHTDMAMLFEEFDTNWSTRTDTEQTKAHQMAEIALQDLAEQKVKKLASGIGFYFKHKYLGHPGVPKIDLEAKNGFIHQYVEFIVLAEPFALIPRLANQGVAGAIFATYLEDPEDCKEFWNLVSEESHADPKHITRLFSRWLTNPIAGKYASDASKSLARMRMACSIFSKWRKNMIVETSRSGNLTMPRRLPEWFYEQPS